MSKTTELFSKLKDATLDFGKNQLAALNGLLGQLPDSLKASFTQLRDNLQARQTELEAFFATAPAEGDATTALNHLTGAFTRLQDYAAGLATQLTAAITRGNEATVALQGWQTKVDSGELFSKEKVKGLTDAAFANGEASLRPIITGLRKKAVEEAGLPAAGEAFLSLPQDQFDAGLTAAKGNVKTLNEKFGFALNGSGSEWVVEAAYQDATGFDKTVKKISALVPARRPGGDPMLTGPGGSGGRRRIGGC